MEYPKEVYEFESREKHFSLPFLEVIRMNAYKAMKFYGLIQKGWVFEFDRAKRRFGCCKPNKKLITLSEELTELNFDNEQKIFDTILHEIAHAIDFEKRGRSDHSYKWKTIAKSIGCTAERCYTGEVKQPKAKYTYGCPNCGHKLNRHRKVKRGAACAKCCKKYNGGKWCSDYVLHIVEER